jgi:prevent-host-death family protein
MTSEIPVTQAREELADLINRVAYGRERIVLTRHSRPVAVIVPPADLAVIEEHERAAGQAESSSGEPQTEEGLREDAGITYIGLGSDPEGSHPEGSVPLNPAALNQPPGQSQDAPGAHPDAPGAQPAVPGSQPAAARHQPPGKSRD